MANKPTHISVCKRDLDLVCLWGWFQPYISRGWDLFFCTFVSVYLLIYSLYICFYVCVVRFLYIWLDERLIDRIGVQEVQRTRARGTRWQIFKKGVVDVKKGCLICFR